MKPLNKRHFLLILTFNIVLAINAGGFLTACVFYIESHSLLANLSYSLYKKFISFDQANQSAHFAVAAS